MIILGGIYSGMFTPTEAAAVAAVYSAFIALFVYRDMSWRECPKVLLESGRLTIMLLFIIANAMLFAHVLTTEQIPQQITQWVLSEGLTPLPPVGLNLFVTSAVTGLTLGQTIRAALPWLSILLLFLVLVTYVPFISLALPAWLGMP